MFRGPGEFSHLGIVIPFHRIEPGDLNFGISWCAVLEIDGPNLHVEDLQN